MEITERTKKLRRETTHKNERLKLKRGFSKQIKFKLTNETFERLREFRVLKNLTNKEVVFSFIDFDFSLFKKSNEKAILNRYISYLVKSDEFERFKEVRQLKKELKASYEDLIAFMVDNF